jgi:alpha-mannosidase
VVELQDGLNALDAAKQIDQALYKAALACEINGEPCSLVTALKDGDTLHQAYDLNLPMTAVKAQRGAGKLPERFSLFTLKAEGVIAETVKKAYDSEDTVIRMYEAKNMKEKATLTFGFPVAEVWECDLEENPIRALPVKNGSVRLELKPFEILTLKAVSPKEEA